MIAGIPWQAIAVICVLSFTLTIYMIRDSNGSRRLREMAARVRQAELRAESWEQQADGAREARDRWRQKAQELEEQLYPVTDEDMEYVRKSLGGSA